MGLHPTTTQVGLFCPPNFSLSRPCPCFFASLRGGSSSSSRPSSNALHRFWADSRRILFSRNYSPSLRDSNSTPGGWSQESSKLRESRQRYNAPRNGLLHDSSYSSFNQTETALADSRCVMPEDKFRCRPDEGFLVNVENYDKSVQSTEKHRSLDYNNLASSNGRETESEMQNCLPSFRNKGDFLVKSENIRRDVQSIENWTAGGDYLALDKVNGWARESKRSNGLSCAINDSEIYGYAKNHARAVQSAENQRGTYTGNRYVNKVNGRASKQEGSNGLASVDTIDRVKSNRLVMAETSDQEELSGEDFGEGASPNGNRYVNKVNGWASKQEGSNGVASVNTIDRVKSNRLVMAETSDQEELSGEDFGEGASPNGLNGTNKATAARVPETRSDLREVSSNEKLHQKQLASVYDSVLVVDCISMANEVVSKLINQYRDLVHACDTEVANIDVKQETPINHGEITCFSIYSGPLADFGNGKSCIWVDVLDGGGKDLLLAFKPFFEDNSIRKVWHNYSFDNHVIENYGIHVRGFHADTIHMARLWDSSRRINGGYSLEALTGNHQVMNRAPSRFKELIGKLSMKTIFGKRKLKKDGSEGKIVTIASVEELQRTERVPWICYSSLDAIKTLELHESLAKKLSEKVWKFDGKEVHGKSMLDFYHMYWKPFGEILVQMETEGMLVDRAYLAEIEKIARVEQGVAVNRFRNWASKYCADAKYMNVGSDTQLRQLLFGGISNRKDPSISLPYKKSFKVPNVDNLVEEGKKKPTKFRNIELNQIGVELPTEIFTASGWPSASGDALKALAGKVSAEYYIVNDDPEIDLEVLEEELESRKSSFLEDVDTSAYGPALDAFPSRDEGIEACHAIASLCEVCSIDSLISNFILPLQGDNISGKSGRIHCSLNINTETGRLSARRPNLQNQPALEKDRYKIRQAFVAAPGNSLVVADYGQLELRILAHVANCRSMLDAFEAGGDFHSRTAMNMYSHIRDAVENKQVLLEWYPQPGEEKPPVPLLKDAFGSERRKAKMLNFSIAYGKTPVGLARDWKVSVEEAKETVDRWYSDRLEVLKWQEARKREARMHGCVHTLLGRARNFPLMKDASRAQRNHIERAAINTPIQGSAADVAMCAMLEISKNMRLKELGWRLLLQVHDEVILEGPTESAEVAKAIVVDCMSKPFGGRNILRVDLSVDAKCAQNWYSAK